MKRLFLIVGLLGVWSSRAGPAPARQFRKGDVWAVVGDSITHGRRYHSFIYLYYATRFPDRPFKTVNCGISGDSAAGAVRRFDWDIAPHKPSVATIMLGMNDVGRGNYGRDKNGAELEKRRQASIDGHLRNMTRLSELLRDLGCDIIYLTPSIYDQTAEIKRHNNYGVNDALGLCGRRVTDELAPTFRAGVADLHGPMTALNTACQREDPTRTIVGADRVHPGDLGQFIMAYLFLKAQNVPSTVAEMALDAGGRVLRSENCTVRDVRVDDVGMSFSYLAKALPYPVPQAARGALELVPFAEELNREVLSVTGLPEGEYMLLIEGEPVLLASAPKLAGGINLASNTRTPMHRQAVAVAAINERRHAVPARRLRTFAAQRHFMGRREGLDTADYDAMKAALETRVAELKASGHSLYAYMKGQAEVYIKYKPQEQQLIADMEKATEELWQANRPRTHRFVVRPATDADRGALRATLIDSFTAFQGWTPTGWTDVEPELSCDNGVLTVRMPRRPDKRDMLGYTKRCAIDLGEANTLKVRLRASKGTEFGAELVIDGKLERLLNYVKASGDWQTLSCSIPGQRVAGITLILAESSANVAWEQPTATYEIDSVLVE